MLKQISSGRTVSSARSCSRSFARVMAEPSGPSSAANASACCPRAWKHTTDRQIFSALPDTQRAHSKASAWRFSGHSLARGTHPQYVQIELQLLLAAQIGRLGHLLRRKAAGQLQQLVTPQTAATRTCTTAPGISAPSRHTTHAQCSMLGCSPAEAARACRTRLVTAHHRQLSASGPPLRCSFMATCCCFAKSKSLRTRAAPVNTERMPCLLHWLAADSAHVQAQARTRRAR